MAASIWLAIELGGMRVNSATTLSELLIFIVGLLLLTGLTAVLLHWNRRGRLDPFV
ncbi:MAG: hypothetical protein KJ063_18525 [Anaerolineae bacterium]|nr:hypothetical protein [Anaerolineae bacterium]